MSATATIEAPVSVPAAPARNDTHATDTRHRFTLKEYFALEAASEIRYEYDEGELIPMAGTSAPHNRITLNLSFAFDQAFGNRSCEVYMQTVGFRVSPLKYRYPDVMALCGTPQFDDRNPPCLLNPNVVVEVLSDSTENTDKGRKIEEYLQLETVTDYLLVAQNRVSVAHWSKNSERDWTRKEYIELSDTVTLSSIGVTVTLAEVYRRVKFDTADDGIL